VVNLFKHTWSDLIDVEAQSVWFDIVFPSEVNVTLFIIRQHYRPKQS